MVAPETDPTGKVTVRVPIVTSDFIACILLVL